MNITVPRKTGTLREHLDIIDALDNLEQKSQKWLDTRKELITASSAFNIIPTTPRITELYNSVIPKDNAIEPDLHSNSGYFNSEYIYYKRKLGMQYFTGNSATLFGQKYEDITNWYYSKDISKKINEYGLLKHSEYPWLASSPDGITEDGVAIEIKTLYTRKMIPDYIPLKYYIQVQITLEVLDLEYCDYLETSVEEYTSFIAFWKDLKDSKEYGIVKETLNGKEYYYNTNVIETKQITNTDSDITFFKVLKRQNKRIDRDREFFMEIFPYLQQGYQKLVQLKEGKLQLKDLKGYTDVF